VSGRAGFGLSQRFPPRGLLDNTAGPDIAAWWPGGEACERSPHRAATALVLALASGRRSLPPPRVPTQHPQGQAPCLPGRVQPLLTDRGQQPTRPNSPFASGTGSSSTTSCSPTASRSATMWAPVSSPPSPPAAGQLQPGHPATRRQRSAGRGQQTCRHPPARSRGADTQLTDALLFVSILT
jgi:hypothetical protein